MKKDFLKAVIVTAVLMCAELGVASSVEGDEAVLAYTKKPIQQPVVLISSGISIPQIMVMGMQKGVPQPFLIHAFPNRGALAMALDRLSITTGTSPKIKEVREMLVALNGRRGSVAFSCEDANVRAVIRKVLSSWKEEDPLGDVMIVVLDEAQCDPETRQLLDKTGVAMRLG